MKKVYIKFGEFHSDGYENVYQGLLEGNHIRIVIPEASYLTYQSLASHLDDSVYVVDGDEICDTTEGGLTLVNARIVGELKMDDDINAYYCDDHTLWRLNNKPERVNETVYERGIPGLIQRFVDYWNED